MDFETALLTEFANLLKAPIEDSVSASEAGEVILIRHAQAIPVSERGSDQMLDPPLSKMGHQQAMCLTRALRRARLVAVYASDMKRCLETGKGLADCHGLEVVAVPALREVEILRKLPFGKLLTDIISQSEWGDAGSRFVKTGQWDAFPLSEGSAEFRGRVRVALDDAIAKHEKGVVCVICHGGVINAYLAELLGIKRDYFFRPAHCSMCRIRCGRTGRIIVSMNEVCHIGSHIRSD